MHPVNPNGNQVFSYDSEKYVYQKDVVRPHVHEGHLQLKKPFKVDSPEKANKTKKDLEKDKQKKKKQSPYDMMKEDS